MNLPLSILVLFAVGSRAMPVSFWAGEWTMSKGSFVAPSVLFDETVAIFNLTETQPDVLAGTLEFVDKVSSTPVGSLFASVEVKDDHAGVVSLSTSPSGTFSPLFSYELDHSPDGFLLGFGDWAGNADIAPAGTVQMMVTSNNTMTLTVIPKDPKDKVVVWVGVKTIVEIPKTFWQKYSTYFMVTGLVVLQLVVRLKFNPKLQELKAQGERQAAEREQADKKASKKKQK